MSKKGGEVTGKTRSFACNNNLITKSAEIQYYGNLSTKKKKGEDARTKGGKRPDFLEGCSK